MGTGEDEEQNKVLKMMILTHQNKNSRDPGTKKSRYGAQ